MSAFKRRDGHSSATQSIKGSKISPSNGLLHLSSGSAAIDDLLGGSAGGSGGAGICTNTLNLIVETDNHATYADVLQRYYISQGLVSHHKVIGVGIDVKNCMWLSKPLENNEKDNDEDEDDKAAHHTEGRGSSKIAWRYENMKTFETSVNSNIDSNFLSTFDLTKVVPDSVIKKAIDNGKLDNVDHCSSYDELANRLNEIVRKHDGKSALRIAIRNVGGWEYGEFANDEKELFKFLFKLRAIARFNKYVVVHLTAQEANIGHCLKRLQYIVDTCISLESFSDAPHRAAAFAPSHGILHLHSSPSLHTLVTPSARHSVLRGGLRAGDNNLAFKLRRKKLVVETLHLDVEGGVGERRTKPSASASQVDDTQSRVRDANLKHQHQSQSEVSIEGVSDTHVHSHKDTHDENENNDQIQLSKPNKTKGPRRVAFQSDKPELYEF